MHGGVTGKASDGLPMSISAQGSSLREPWDQHIKRRSNPEKGSPTAEPFQGLIQFLRSSQGCRWRSNPGLKLANAFGVIVYAAKNNATEVSGKRGSCYSSSVCIISLKGDTKYG